MIAIFAHIFDHTFPVDDIGWQFGGITNLPGRNLQGPYELNFEALVPKDVRAMVQA